LEEEFEKLVHRSGQRSIAFAGLALLGLLASPAYAVSLPAAAKIQAAFNAVDTNRNGAIDGVEWNHASFALFRAADKNNDEFIDREELRSSQLAPDTFLRADLNRDERLSVSEFTDLRRALFNIADIDRDDSLSPVEFELFIIMERVGWLDSNRNGRIEISELTASLRAAFAALDAEADGELTAAEAAYLRPEAFKRYDTSGDGKLSRDEYVAGYRTEMISG
jgi:Ca2+-binding EF-hand superfamily protein